MERRWSAVRDNSHSNVIDEDENMDKDKDTNKDTDTDKDKDMDEDTDKDTDKDSEDENEILGLSTWDLLGEGFKREATALGLSYIFESFA